ncbi:hypothetical protein EVJ58_g9720 [Rhodofomes roseus]|uniref:NmrA-like domain-containing protein n=1 Tax=Rhodofomes roseus TaxID=34475 RepID=A0A4Y9XWK3_9APHY|nr:hypothetical protein EVJ58_g9720 [Rhodofomes roseus]
MQAHLDTEAYLKQSGLTYTIIREGIYSESYPLYFGYWSPSEGTDEVVVPHGDGAIAWVSRPDLGDGTARIVAAVRILSPLCTLTDGHAAAVRHARRHAVSARVHGLRPPQPARAPEGRLGGRVRRGAHRAAGAARRGGKWATTYRALGRGECAVADPTLREIIGREPTPFEETVREMLGVDGEGAVDRYAW